MVSCAENCTDGGSSPAMVTCYCVRQQTAFPDNLGLTDKMYPHTGLWIVMHDSLKLSDGTEVDTSYVQYPISSETARSRVQTPPRDGGNSRGVGEVVVTRDARVNAKRGVSQFIGR